MAYTSSISIKVTDMYLVTEKGKLSIKEIDPLRVISEKDRTFANIMANQGIKLKINTAMPR